MSSTIVSIVVVLARCPSTLLLFWCPERRSQHPFYIPPQERAALCCHRQSLRRVFHSLPSHSQRTIASLFTQMLQQFLMFSPFLSFFYFYRATFPFLTTTLKGRIKKKKKKRNEKCDRAEGSQRESPAPRCTPSLRQEVDPLWVIWGCLPSNLCPVICFSLLHLVQPPSSTGEERRR